MTWSKNPVSLVKQVSSISNFVFAIATETKSEFEREHSRAGGGRVYLRGGRLHRASSAGDYPAKDTGALLRKTKVKNTQTTGTVGTNAHYAKYLANGTKKMAKRKMYKEAMIATIKGRKAKELADFIKYE